MATAPNPALQPPPGAAPPSAPTNPVAASPMAGSPNPALEKASGIVIQIVQMLRALSQAFPATAPLVDQANQIVRQIQIKMMANTQPAEPPAPPTAG